MEKSHSHNKESTLKPFKSHQDPCLCLTHLSYSSRTFERRASGDRNLNHRSELVSSTRDSNERENEEELESRVIEEEEGLPIRNRVALAFMAPVYSFCFLINTVPVLAKRWTRLSFFDCFFWSVLTQCVKKEGSVLFELKHPLSSCSF